MVSTNLIRETSHFYKSGVSIQLSIVNCFVILNESLVSLLSWVWYIRHITMNSPYTKAYIEKEAYVQSLRVLSI